MESARGRVPDYVFATQETFVECPGCTRLYWRGTHWRNMVRELASGGRRPELSRTAAFVYHDRLSRHVLRDDHVMVPTRLRYTYELLESYGAFAMPNAVLVEPRQADWRRSFSPFTRRDYVDAVGEP